MLTVLMFFPIVCRDFFDQKHLKTIKQTHKVDVFTLRYVLLFHCFLHFSPTNVIVPEVPKLVKLHKFFHAVSNIQQPYSL